MPGDGRGPNSAKRTTEGEEANIRNASSINAKTLDVNSSQVPFAAPQEHFSSLNSLVASKVRFYGLPFKRVCGDRTDYFALRELDGTCRSQVK